VETICPKLGGDFHPTVEVQPFVAPFEAARSAVLDERLVRSSQKSVQYGLNDRRRRRRLGRRERRKGDQSSDQSEEPEHRH
jgi:hypothetical protein